MTEHKIGSREEWQAAREELLQREKEHTRMGDELARQRRELPWVPLEKEYRFETDEGTRTLAELFDGRTQLLVYHFMFGPSYEAGCPTCSSMADTVDGTLPHLHARDVTMMYVSQAPLEKLQTYKRRMGWNMPWSRRRAATSTSTSATHAPRSRRARRSRRCSRRDRRRSPSSLTRTLTRAAPISRATSPRARASAHSSWTTAPCIRPIRLGLAESSS